MIKKKHIVDHRKHPTPTMDHTDANKTTKTSIDNTSSATAPTCPTLTKTSATKSILSFDSLEVSTKTTTATSSGEKKENVPKTKKKRIFYKFTEEDLINWDNCTYTKKNVKRVMEEQGYTKEKHALKWLQKLCKKLVEKRYGKLQELPDEPRTKSPSPPEDEERRLQDAEDKYNKKRRKILADQYSPNEILDVKFSRTKAKGGCGCSRHCGDAEWCGVSPEDY